MCRQNEEPIKENVASGEAAKESDQRRREDQGVQYCSRDKLGRTRSNH